MDYRFNAVHSDVQRATKFDDSVPKLQREKASSLTQLPRLIFAQETVSLIVKYAKALKYPSTFVLVRRLICDEATREQPICPNSSIKP